MSNGNGGNNCWAEEYNKVLGLVQVYKAPDFENPVETMSMAEYIKRTGRALLHKEVWRGGEELPDVRHMMQPPERYDEIFSEGERFAHGSYMEAGRLGVDQLLAGERVIAQENLAGLGAVNPYAGRVAVAAVTA